MNYSVPSYTTGSNILHLTEGQLIDMATGGNNYSNAISSFFSSSFDTTDVSRPHGYLVWILYDNNMRLIPQGSGAKRITNPNDLEELIEDEIPISENGYLHAYVTNGSAARISFDNFLVTYIRGKTRQINHYYPYGLSIDGLDHSDEYLNKYTSKELQTGEFDSQYSSGLEMFDFGSRFYDPQVGRWFTPDPAEQFHNPYLGIGNNPVMYVDPDGEFIWIAIGIGAAIGAYIGGSSANDGQMNPIKWNWESGHTWAGIGLGAVVGGAGGYAFAVGGPALAHTAFFANFGASGTAAAYTIAGGVSMGVAGYGAGFGSAMLRTKGDWGYSHQAGMFGMQVGASIGSFAGGVYGLAKGVDFSMPEYEEPPSLEWNKPLTASTGNGFNSIQDNPSPDDLRKIYSRSYHEFQNMIGNNTIGYSTNSGTEFPTWLYSNASLYPDPMYLPLAPQLEGVNAAVSTIVYRLGSSINLNGSELLRIGPDPTWPDQYPYFTYPDRSNYFDGAMYYQMKIQWIIPNLFSFLNTP